MFDRIYQLKEKGYCPDAILDIGAHHGNWTMNMKQIYDSTYYLFEAISYSELGRFRHNDTIHVYNVLLNDKIEMVPWYQMKNTGDSMFKEKSSYFTNHCDIIQRESIDLNTFIVQQNILHDSKNIFIKIDCQGAEIPILKGATSILEKTDFILLEIPLFGQYNEGVPNFLEHIQYMNSIGFIAYDILENHYINQFNMQIDMLFINKHHEFNRIINNN